MIDAKGNQFHREHRRQWRQCAYVYPVVSRRARGLSIGVNLSPDKRCTFSCLYCQIDRSTHRGLDEVRLENLREELDLALEEALSGRLWQEPSFGTVPARLRRINDIAFSGDGEPTLLPNFDDAVRVAAEAKAAHGADDVKLVVITNATMLRSPQVERALPVLDANNGEIWAKLDAGTEEWFARVNQPSRHVTLRDVLDGIIAVARARPVVIQTLLFRSGADQPPAAELAAYVDRLREIVSAGGRIKLVQLHTIARLPMVDPSAQPLPAERLEEVAGMIRHRIPGVPVEVF